MSATARFTKPSSEAIQPEVLAVTRCRGEQQGQVARRRRLREACF
jgi:hypothetical protein